MEGLHSDPRGLGPEWCPGPRPYSAHPYPWRTSRVLWGRWRGQGGERISHAGRELGEPRHGEGGSWLLGFLTWPLWASIASFIKWELRIKVSK